MTLDWLNSLDEHEARVHLAKCCGAERWIHVMAAKRPYRTIEELFGAAVETWNALGPDDWREAFKHHPRIGDRNSLRQKFTSTGAWAAREQSGVDHASEEILRRLAEGNVGYEKKFGYIFIVCATGKTAEEMLALLESRLQNTPEEELFIAAAEQARITHVRLEKLLSQEN